MSDITSSEKADIIQARLASTEAPPEIAVIELSDTETELVGNCECREELKIINDSSRFIFVGFSDSYTLDESITLFSGQVLTITFGDGDFPVYAKLEEGTTTIKIMEVK
jgi:hypothetical protein